MLPLLRSNLTFFASIAAVSAVVGFLDAWSPGLGFQLLLLGVPATLIASLLGTMVLAVRGLRARGRIGHRLGLAAAPLGLLAITIAASLFLLRTGNWVGSLTRLMVNRGHYERIIARVRRQHEQAWYKDDGGVTYSTDLGPPVRVAFNPAGMLDNWSGIIFDPTGDVMEANGFDPVTGRFRAPPSVTKLFGGDLVSCRALRGDYYLCSFT